MPVPMSTLGGTSPLPHSRPGKRGRQRKNGALSSFLDVNSQLLDAISQEKTSVVRRLLSCGADPNTCSTTPSGDPALLLACSIPDLETRHIILSLLLTKGASVDSANGAGVSALMRAAMAGDSEACKLLLDASAKVGKEDCDGNTAVSYAAQNGSEEAARVIVLAAKKQGCDIDHRNMKGLTGLLLACQNGHLSTARILVQEGGASPNIRDLDNFMTAAELMQKSRDYLESDLTFLFPVSRKKSYYRRQRQERGIKTLSDYLSESESTSNVSKSTERDSACLQRLSVSPSPHKASRSMFHIPSASNPPAVPSSPFHKKSILPPVHRPPPIPKPKLSFSHDYKSDLYRSHYLKKRQLYVTPNRQSNGFRAGSLQPIPGNPLERIQQATQAESREEVTTVSSGRGRKEKHQGLPPLKKHTELANITTQKL